MIWVGFRGAGEGLRPSTPTAWLAIGGAFLLGFRIALNIADSGVIDVGYAGVIGADHLVHGQAIWNNFPSDNVFGDTYGPFNYYAYVPFELVFPWSGHWDDLPAAHAAAIAFDLATVGGLFAVGRRLRPGPAGTRLGVVLGFAWAAYPFTDYALQSNSNDALVAALLVWATRRLRVAGEAGRAARPLDRHQVRAASARAAVRRRGPRPADEGRLGRSHCSAGGGRWGSSASAWPSSSARCWPCRRSIRGSGPSTTGR